MDIDESFWKLVKSPSNKDNAVLTKNLKISHPESPSPRRRLERYYSNHFVLSARSLRRLPGGGSGLPTFLSPVTERAHTPILTGPGFTHAHPSVREVPEERTDSGPAELSPVSCGVRPGVWRGWACYCGSFFLKSHRVEQALSLCQVGCLARRWLHLLTTSGYPGWVHCQSLAPPLCKSDTQLSTALCLNVHGRSTKSALPRALGGGPD